MSLHTFDEPQGPNNNEEIVNPTGKHLLLQINQPTNPLPRHHHTITSCAVLCHGLQGHHIEQYRIYEAIESGAIPVLSRDSGYLERMFPPEYLASPMLIVDRWEDAVSAMTSLMQAPNDLDARQRELQAWNSEFMHRTVQSIEQVLEERMAQKHSGFCTQYRQQMEDHVST